VANLSNIFVAPELSEEEREEQRKKDSLKSLEKRLEQALERLHTTERLYGESLELSNEINEDAKQLREKRIKLNAQLLEEGNQVLQQYKNAIQEYEGDRLAQLKRIRNKEEELLDTQIQIEKEKLRKTRSKRK